MIPETGVPVTTYNRSRTFAIASCLGITNVTSHQTNARPISRGVLRAIARTWFLVSGLTSVNVLRTIFHRMLDQKPDLTEPYKVRTACFQSPRANSMNAIIVERAGEIQLNKTSGKMVKIMRINSTSRRTREMAN